MGSIKNWIPTLRCADNAPRFLGFHFVDKEREREREGAGSETGQEGRATFAFAIWFVGNICCTPEVVQPHSLPIPSPSASLLVLFSIGRSFFMSDHPQCLQPSPLTPPLNEYLPWAFCFFSFCKIYLANRLVHCLSDALCLDPQRLNNQKQHKERNDGKGRQRRGEG